MAVDNLLSVQAVLANGSVVTASACSHADLFWALRGGGGSSFGVVTSCTYRAHPFPAAGAAGAFITIELLQGNTSFAVLMDGFLAYAPGLGDANNNGAGVVAGGYFIPVLDAPEGTHEHMSFLLGVNGTTDQVDKLFAPFAAWVATMPQYLTIIGADIRPFPSLMQFHEYFDDSSEATGYAGTLGSRLIPQAVMQNDTARLAVALALTEIVYTTGSMTGMLVTGGAVAAADAGATSINPAWRTAGSHIAFGISWPINASLAEQQQLFADVNELTDLLRETCDADGRGAAAYWSESDYLESDWQQAFWGSNYPRLQAVKAAVDPAGVFGCHHCVELPAANLLFVD
jgi:FAD/FMN-containing dehydrogenase